MKQTIFSNTIAKALVNFGGDKVFHWDITDWAVFEGDGYNAVSFFCNTPLFRGLIYIEKTRYDELKVCCEKLKIQSVISLHELISFIDNLKMSEIRLAPKDISMPLCTFSQSMAQY